MKSQALLLAPLAAVLSTSSAFPARRGPDPAMCPRSGGVYDICDTEHSFIRCDGHEAILATDCRLDKSSYCQIINGKGRCDGNFPPDLAGEAPECEAGPSPDSST